MFALVDCCDLIAVLDQLGWRFAAGVPCSTYEGMIAHWTEDQRYHAAANEGLALSYAAGATLAGRPTVTVLQNSGLGNLINPATSLMMPYGVGGIVLVSLRGWPDPDADEPQHRVMGSTTERLLTDLGLNVRLLAGEGYAEIAAEAAAEAAAGKLSGLLVPYRSIGRHTGRPPVPQTRPRPEVDLSEAELVATVVGSIAESTVVVATTGFTSRLLYAAGDRALNFYMQGSMGHALSIGLGVASAQPDRAVVVLDGDGAALMHLGSWPSVGELGPANLLHVIIANGTYKSTGAQAISAPAADFATIGRGAGYVNVAEVSTVAELNDRIKEFGGLLGPSLIVAMTAGRAAETPPPRASAEIALPDIGARFQAALG